MATNMFVEDDYEAPDPNALDTTTPDDIDELMASYYFDPANGYDDDEDTSDYTDDDDDDMYDDEPHPDDGGFDPNGDWTDLDDDEPPPEPEEISKAHHTCSVVPREHGKYAGVCGTCDHYFRARDTESEAWEDVEEHKRGFTHRNMFSKGVAGDVKEEADHTAWMHEHRNPLSKHAPASSSHNAAIEPGDLPSGDPAEEDDDRPDEEKWILEHAPKISERKQDSELT